MGLFSRHMGILFVGVMGLFFGPLGKKLLESWASFFGPLGIFFWSHRLIFGTPRQKQIGGMVPRFADAAAAGAERILRSRLDPSPNAPWDQIHRKGPCCDLCLLAMYGGVVTVMVGIVIMTPETLPPYT